MNTSIKRFIGFGFFALGVWVSIYMPREGYNWLACLAGASLFIGLDLIIGAKIEDYH